MKTPAKRSQAAPIIRAHDFGPYVNEPVRQCPTKIGSKVTAKKSNHDERLKQLQQSLIVQKN